MNDLKLDAARKTIEKISKIGLVACAKSKRREALPAEELYSSELFKRAIMYSRRNYDRWYILSAKYGLVKPNTVLRPYDETLNARSQEARRLWADMTIKQLASTLPKPKECSIFFHAGATYREFLFEKLAEAGYHCEVPLEGLGIGRQLAWYEAHKTE